MTKIDSPYIVKVQEVLEAEQRFYMVMEHLDGGNVSTPVSHFIFVF